MTPPAEPPAEQRKDLEALGYVSSESQPQREKVARDLPAAAPPPAPAKPAAVESRVEGGVAGSVSGGVVGGVVGGVPGAAPADELQRHRVQRPATEALPLRQALMAEKKEKEKDGKAYDTVLFKSAGTNPFVDAETDRFSTFGLDVDTGSYAVARRYIGDGNLPDPDSVRGE